MEQDVLRGKVDSLQTEIQILREEVSAGEKAQSCLNLLQEAQQDETHAATIRYQAQQAQFLAREARLAEREADLLEKIAVEAEREAERVEKEASAAEAHALLCKRLAKVEAERALEADDAQAMLDKTREALRSARDEVGEVRLKLKGSEKRAAGLESEKEALMTKLALAEENQAKKSRNDSSMEEILALQKALCESEEVKQSLLSELALRSKVALRLAGAVAGYRDGSVEAKEMKLTQERDDAYARCRSMSQEMEVLKRVVSKDANTSSTDTATCKGNIGPILSRQPTTNTTNRSGNSVRSPAKRKAPQPGWSPLRDRGAVNGAQPGRN